MAALDPTAEAEEVDGENVQPRATLRLIRAPLMDMDDEDDSEFDPDEMDAMLASDEDGESSDEEAGPSDPAKSKKARKAAAVKQLKKELAEEMELDDAPKKGKGKQLDISEDFEDDDEDEDDEDESDDEDFEPEEFVLCTLDPTKVSLKCLPSLATSC